MGEVGRTGAEYATLLVFTESYPYSAAIEDTFLGPELPYLNRVFGRTVVIPSRRDGTRADPPDGIEVDEGLAVFLATNSTAPGLVRRALLSGLFWRDIAKRPDLLTDRRGLKRLVRSAARAELVRLWVKKRLLQLGTSPGDCVGYTFWFDDVATGLALVKSELPDFVTVSRAHGADLYLERHDPPYLPCREFALAHVDRLFPDSDRGVRYVVERYPSSAARCEVARMGVVDPGFLSTASAGQRFVVVSCSLIVPVKRVDLILAGVDRAARSRPDRQFEWHHFGEGERRTILENQAQAMLPTNASAHLHGYPGLAGLLAFYKTHSVDVFLNASLSEGTPIAIMEAASCGIPIIATAVGGNPEIVSQQNGMLLTVNPTPEEIGDALLGMVDNPSRAARLRTGSRRVWESKYDAATSYGAFARRLSEVLAES